MRKMAIGIALFICLLVVSEGSANAFTVVGNICPIVSVGHMATSIVSEGYLIRYELYGLGTRQLHRTSIMDSAMTIVLVNGGVGAIAEILCLIGLTAEKLSQDQIVRTSVIAAVALGVSIIPMAHAGYIWANKSNWFGDTVPQQKSHFALSGSTEFLLSASHQTLYFSLFRSF